MTGFITSQAPRVFERCASSVTSSAGQLVQLCTFSSVVSCREKVRKMGEWQNEVVSVGLGGQVGVLWHVGRARGGSIVIFDLAKIPLGFDARALTLGEITSIR